MLLYYIDITCEDGTVHLVGGNDVSRGRVEYCYEGTWYSVCASDWEDKHELSVVPWDITLVRT